MEDGTSHLQGDAVDAVLAQVPLRAAGFIVTLYGDVVLPRGGEIWIGNIIEVCAGVGISETLVRTAVSRLVAAGQLEGRRAGRRSFYRLARAAEGEFSRASHAIYGPAEDGGWCFVYLPDRLADSLMAQLERAGFARLKPQLAIGPDHIAVPEGALVFHTAPMPGAAHLPEFAASAWDLASHARAYAAFAARFGALAENEVSDGAGALTLRLLLVHAYRQVLLRDPRLPSSALPADWPGIEARRVFARAYLALSKAADSHVATRFEAVSGALANQTADTKARREMLEQVLRG